MKEGEEEFGGTSRGKRSLGKGKGRLKSPKRRGGT